MLLSVLLPNYNHSQYLENRISCIISQLSDDCELIIVDDASTDNSVSIIKKIAEKEKRIKFIINSLNQGVNRSFNIALEAAQGDYIIAQAVDDIMLDGFIDNCLNMLLKNPTIPICFSPTASIIESDIHSLDLFPFFDPMRNPFILNPKDLIKLCQRNKFELPAPCIIKRSKFIEYGGYNRELGPLSDWYLNHAIAFNHGMIMVPKVSFVTRQTKNNFSSLNEKQKRDLYPRVFHFINNKIPKKIKSQFIKSTILKFHIFDMPKKYFLNIDILATLLQISIYHPIYLAFRFKRKMKRLLSKEYDTNLSDTRSSILKNLNTYCTFSESIGSKE